MTKFIDAKREEQKEKKKEVFFEKSLTKNALLLTSASPQNYDNVVNLFTIEHSGSVFVSWNDECSNDKHI